MLTEQQLLERRKGIGGSDAAAICGRSVYKTPLDVYLDKIGICTQQIVSDDLTMGNKMEPMILSMYEDLIGIELKEESEFPLNTKTENYFMKGNLDGFYFDGNGNLVIVDAKNKHYLTKKQFGELGTSEMPHDILLQMAHYRILYDAFKVDVAVYFGGSDFCIYTYQKNEKLEKYLVEKEKFFWENHVLAQVPPEPTSLEDVKKMWEFSEPQKTICSDDMVLKFMDSLKQIKQIKKELEDSENDLKLKIQSFMKDSEILCSHLNGEILATFKSSKRNGLDQKLLKEKFPEIFDSAQKTTDCRTFLIK